MGIKEANLAGLRKLALGNIKKEFVLEATLSETSVPISKIEETKKSKLVSLKRISEEQNVKDGVFWSGYMTYFTGLEPEVT